MLLKTQSTLEGCDADLISYMFGTINFDLATVKWSSWHSWWSHRQDQVGWAGCALSSPLKPYTMNCRAAPWQAENLDLSESQRWWNANGSSAVSHTTDVYRISRLRKVWANMPALDKWYIQSCNWGFKIFSVIGLPNKKPLSCVMSIALFPKSLSKLATFLPQSRKYWLTFPWPLNSSISCHSTWGSWAHWSIRT